MSFELLLVLSFNNERSLFVLFVFKQNSNPGLDPSGAQEVKCGTSPGASLSLGHPMTLFQTRNPTEFWKRSEQVVYTHPEFSTFLV